MWFLSIILCYKIINGLAEISFEGICIEVYKDTRTKQNKTLRQIGHSTSSMVSHFPPKLLIDGTGLLSQKPYHWQNFDNIIILPMIDNYVIL